MKHIALTPIISTVVRETTHVIAIRVDDVEVARTGRLCPLRRAMSRLFPDLSAQVGVETFGLRHPEDGRLVARGVLPVNAQHFLRLYDQGVGVRGVRINLIVEWYEDFA